MNKFLTFDVGTTAMKCILFNEEFTELFYANKEYSINAQPGGIAELDANVYFDTFCECIKDMLSSGIASEEITSITFTTQGETMIPMGKDGKALCPAMVWLDTRAEAEAEYIKSKASENDIYKKTGLYGIDGALPLAKALWIKNNKPEIYANTYKILLLEDYLIYRLTSRFVSEKSLQSSTGWYDIINETYYSEILEICGLDESKLPEVLPCGTVVGGIDKAVADKLGLSENTVIITAAMDQISSAVGIGNIKEGIFTETTGTALVAGITAEKPVFDTENPVTIYKHYDGKFIYMPYCNTAGISLKWFRDKLMPYAEEEGKKKKLSAYGYVDAVAGKAPAGSHGVVMLPQLSQTGAFIGITLSTETSDMARSVLEGVAFMLREITELIDSKDIKTDKIYSLGGGSYSPLWCQIKADVCKKKFVAVDYAQTTALGAAVLASVATGCYETVEAAVEACGKTGVEYIPNPENYNVYDNTFKIYKKYLSLVQEVI